MKGLIKKVSMLIMVVAIFGLLLAPVAVQAGEPDIPRIFSVGPSLPIVHLVD